MEIDFVTRKDLQEFRLQLLEDIKLLLSGTVTKPHRPWLKNAEVKKLLGISSNTVQRLRVSGKLQSTKVGGVHYYRYEDIECLLNQGGK